MAMNSINEETMQGLLHNPKYQVVLRHIQINCIDNREIQLFHLTLLNLTIKEKKIFYIKKSCSILAHFSKQTFLI